MKDFQSESTPEVRRLVVDIGNTSTTLALFTGGSEPIVESIPTGRIADSGLMHDLLGTMVARYGAPEAIAVCSVVPEVAAACTAMFRTMFPAPVVNIGSALRLPFRLDYGDSRTFGADRLALCAWSRNLFEGRAVIAVDIGTAITFDVLDASGTYRGGLIMPGIDMMAGALHSRTAQLPQVRIDRPESLLGSSTEECIRSGIFWGVVRQIEGLVESIGDQLEHESGEPAFEVIATGGNSRLVASEIPTITVIDELAVIRGSDLLLRMNLP